VGDKWSYLQRSKFGANSQPFYVPIDHAGMPLGSSYQHDLDISKYVHFLENGKKEFAARKDGKPIPSLSSPSAQQ